MDNSRRTPGSPLTLEEEGSPTMPSNKQQNFANHGRLDPVFHFFVVPVLLITFVASVVHAVRYPGWWSIWLAIVALALVVLAGTMRRYSLKVQDRVIRLEERLRCTALLPASLVAQTGKISERQWVALRFAPDAELPELVERVVRENLTPKQIKQAIQTWRPDTFRV
jgi:hypothetical protein